MPVTLLLGHGASGNAAAMQPWVQALAAHGVSARALDLPRGSAERAVATYAAALERSGGADVAVGGHSFGGRVASMLASRQQVRAVVLLSYPLHRPGRPEQARTEHWAEIIAPLLFLSGDRDPFARADLLRAEVARLRGAELEIYAGLGHGLLPIREVVAARIAQFLRDVEPPLSATLGLP